jgi:uncharacterized protein with LGFP repeats
MARAARPRERDVMDEVEGPRVDASEGQGVLVGTGNVQHNYYGANSRLDPETLGALNPHAAIAKLRDMPHEDVVLLFAKATPDDVTDVLRVLVDSGVAERDLAVAALADINPRKASEFIAPLTEEFPWVGLLPKAVAAIHSLATSLHWSNASPAASGDRYQPSRLMRVGFFRTYSQGSIYWSGGDDAHSISGTIAKYFTESGQAVSLGYPVGAAWHLKSGASDAEAVVQPFTGGRLYACDQGVYYLYGEILREYLERGSHEGWLGFPVAEAVYEEGAWRQHFEGGVIYLNKGDAHTVRAALLNHVGEYCYPSSGEVAISAHLFSTEGVSQEFEHAAGAKKVIYSSVHGAYSVAGELLQYYRSSGETASRLGFPAGDERRNTGPGDPYVRTSVEQEFEGGVISGQPGSGLFMVPKEAHDLIWGDPDIATRLGFPVSEEEPVGWADDRIQFFENGVVTLRAGKRAAWLRPSEPEPGVNAATPEKESHDTVIVAAAVGWPEYAVTSAYICQEDRVFRENITHLGFYADGEIKPVIPRILGCHKSVLFTRQEAARREQVPNGGARVGAIIEGCLASGTRDEGERYDVYLLTGPDDIETVHLAVPIRNDTTSDSGRATAWTQKQRYTSLDRLTSGVTRASEL